MWYTLLKCGIKRVRFYKMAIYVISDLHFNHTNIIKYCSRPYSDSTKMNFDLIRRWNSVVGEDDLVYNLGDIGWNNGESLKYLISLLNGDQELVFGNHDKGSNDKYLALGFKKIYHDYFSIDYKVNDSLTLKILFSHKPIVSESIAMSLDLTLKSYLIISDEEYDEFDLNIHGHIHNNDREDLKDGKHYNVSVEVIDYKPKLLSDIVWEFIYEDIR